MLVVPEQSPPHFGQSSQKGKGRLSERLVLCWRARGQGRLRQHKHHDRKQQLLGGRGDLSLRSFVGKALTHFF
ncbi:hypothetical protein VL14_03015 [Cytobacillus firmus]|nr:hypothetical protein VL14_03015 [Cytobacillus firmus]